MSEAIRFYCGVSERQWNYHPVEPGPYACVSPVYGRTLQGKRISSVHVPKETLVIQDSGAFSDGPGQRLSLEVALERQLAHAERYGYSGQVTHRASYDLLVDEKWSGGRRAKARWTEEEAEEAVCLTVQAAAYLARHRQSTGAILSLQGVTPQQYLTCAQQIIPFLDARDLIGLGGWCVIGKYPKLFLPVFRQTMGRLIPFLAREQVRRVHLWGVCYAPALAILLRLCQECGVHLSTDSAHPSVHPAFGQWGYANWRDPRYRRPPVLDSCRSGQFDRCAGCRGLERTRHVAATRHWLAHFSVQAHQLTLFDHLKENPDGQ